MYSSDLKLIAIFAIVAATIVLRVVVESTGYCTPDSEYYLEAAQNILDGRGFYHSNQYPIPKVKTPKNQTYFAVWPLGYPLLIAGFAFFFSISVFWASKLVNIFFLGLCFLLFRKMNRKNAYLLSLTMLSFTFLEVFSYTWSEAPFIFGMLWFAYLLYYYLQNVNNFKCLLLLFSSCLFLFLIRYIGGFSFLILGSICAWFMLQKKYKPAFKLLSILVLLNIIGGLYFYNNYLQTGYLTGGERLFPDRESWGLFIWYLFVGLFNEFFIIRNYYWRGGSPDTLFWITSIFQVLLMVFIYFKYLKEQLTFIYFRNNLATLYVVIGMIYLLILIFIRLFSPFDPFDYRLLSPFSICMYTALFILLINPKLTANITGAYRYIIIFFFVSLILNFPKMYLIEIFRSLIRP